MPICGCSFKGFCFYIYIERLLFLLVELCVYNMFARLTGLNAATLQELPLACVIGPRNLVLASLFLQCKSPTFFIALALRESQMYTFGIDVILLAM